MGLLGLGLIKVKSAPTQESSALTTFTVRDLVAFLYIDQDRMGAQSGFFEGNFAKHIKWKYAFEIVHRVFDQSMAHASAALKATEAERSRIEQYIQNAQEFLRDSGVPHQEELETMKVALRAKEGRLLSDLETLALEQRASLGTNQGLIAERQSLEDQIRAKRAMQEERRTVVTRLGRLLVQYEREEQQVEFLAEGEGVFTSVPVVRCPSCLQPVPVNSKDEHSCHVCTQVVERRDDVPMTARRLRGLRARISDLRHYIDDIAKELDRDEYVLTDLGHQHLRTQETLLGIERQQLLPLGRTITERNVELAQLRASINEIEKSIAMRLRARGEGTSLLAVNERILRLEQELTRLREVTPDRSAVINGITGVYGKLAKMVKLPQTTNVSIGAADYLPYVRGEPYSKLSSKGAISIAMATYAIANLVYGLQSISLHPGLVMLDSPLLAVGRDPGDHDFQDQRVVDAFYDLLVTLHGRRSAEFQLLMVDNRPPPQVRSLLAVEFTRQKGVGRFGLIDDENEEDVADVV